MASKFRLWLSAVNQDQPQLGKVLSPSWLSGLVCVVAGLAVIAGVAGLVHYQGSDFQLLRQASVNQPAPINDNFEELDTKFSASQLISDIPLLVFWAGVGLVTYFLTMNIVDALRRTVEFEHQLDYVHADRDQLIRRAVSKAAIRLLFLLLWVLYIQFSQHVLLPYAVALGYAGAWLTSLQSAAYLLGGAVLLAIGLHVHVVLLRLVTFRTRIFGQD